MKGTLVFDIETFEAGLLFTMPPEQFFRIGGYRWAGDREVTLTTDLEELREQILQARWIIGHNINTFDLPAVFGHRSDIPVQLAHEGRVYDTFTHAALVNPAPYKARDRFGRDSLYDKPEKAKKWFGLDEQAFQLGVARKTDDLKELAFEFGNPELPRQERIKDGFGKIPLDDERYRSYLVGDVIASEEVSKALLRLGPLDPYALREQEIAARVAVISSNGFRLHIERAQARVEQLAARRAVIMADLTDRYDFPTEGLAPWDTDAGRRSILAALADAGITPAAVDWPKTPVWAKRGEKLEEVVAKRERLVEEAREWRALIESGELKKRVVETRERWIERNCVAVAEIDAEPLPPYFGLAMGGTELIGLTAGTGAEELGVALAELKGQRSLAQLALDSVHSDGFAHPDITMLQRSGRTSTTKPGLTIWDANGPEKAYWLPDTDDDVLVEFDYSNADARVIAALSGDARYAERFEPGADGHLINAWAAWGKDVVGTDKRDPKTAEYRQLAKPGGHGWGYRIGAKKLAKTWGLPVEQAKAFLDAMNKAFYRVVAWQERMAKFAVAHGYVTNPWGRKMPVERGHEFTQAPALPGQSGTREILFDSVLKMPMPVLRRVKGLIHDALVMSLPKASLDTSVPYLVNLMQARMDPPGGQPIDFPVDAGPPGNDWAEASHR